MPLTSNKLMVKIAPTKEIFNLMMCITTRMKLVLSILEYVPYNPNNELKIKRAGIFQVLKRATQNLQCFKM